MNHTHTLQHSVPHCNTLQHTAVYCNTLQHTETCSTLQHAASRCITLHHAASRCNTLQHTATHCNTLRKFLKVTSTVIVYGELNCKLICQNFKLLPRTHAAAARRWNFSNRCNSSNIISSSFKFLYEITTDLTVENFHERPRPVCYARKLERVLIQRLNVITVYTKTISKISNILTHRLYHKDCI